MMTMANIDAKMIEAIAAKLQPLFNVVVSSNLAIEFLEAALNDRIVVTVEEAALICKRLEHDASWDKCGSGYYSMKWQISEAADARE